MHRFEKQYPDFTKYKQYFGRLDPEAFGVNKVDFAEGYLTPEKIMTLLAIEASDASVQRMNRKNILADQYLVLPDRLFLPLTAVYQPTEAKEYRLGTQIDANATYPNMDHALITLLKSFWILYDAICNPKTIQYDPEAKETSIEEEDIGKLTIKISPHQTNPLISLLIDIYEKYQDHEKNIKTMQENIAYYEELDAFVEGLKTEADLNNSEVILERIKGILNLLSNTVQQFYPKPEPALSSTKEDSTLKNKPIPLLSKIKGIFCCNAETDHSESPSSSSESLPSTPSSTSSDFFPSRPEYHSSNPITTSSSSKGTRSPSLSKLSAPSLDLSSEDDRSPYNSREQSFLETDSKTSTSTPDVSAQSSPSGSDKITFNP